MISALMITGKTPHHRCLAEVAVAQFLAQDWPQKDRELVIVNTAADAPWFHAAKRQGPIRELVLSPYKGTLGELRNISMLDAQGDLLIQWDDDDWHHPSRIRWQAEHHKTGCLSLLKRQYRLDLTSGDWGIADGDFCNRQFRAIVGTMLHQRTRARYPHQRRREDTVFAARFLREGKIDVQDNPPELYVRLYHGHNTWDQRHVMRPALGPRGKGRGDAEFIAEVARAYA